MDNVEMNTHNEENQDSQQEKTFTQAEVEEIIKKRLIRERKKYERGAGQEDQDSGTGQAESSTGASDREKDLTAREMKLMAKEKLMDKGLPLELADCLKFNDEDSLEKAIETITKLNLNRPERKAWGMRLSDGYKEPNDPVKKAFGV